MKSLNRGFSLVELLIGISILVIIGVVATTTYVGYQDNSLNTKVSSDLEFIKNSIVSYTAENVILPNPGGNLKLYDISGVYEHDINKAFGISGFLTRDSVLESFAGDIPIDPRSNQFYAYGVANNYDGFQLAGVVENHRDQMSMVIGNWSGSIGTKTELTGDSNQIFQPFLIKEYNGPDFVVDKLDRYPYNPAEMKLVARLGEVFNSDIKINGSVLSEAKMKNYIFTVGDEILVPSGSKAQIYFSDGSETMLGSISSETRLKFRDMTYKKDNPLWTNIILSLDAGEIWTRAVKLDSNSDFKIQTNQAVAAVRGTVYGVKVVDNSTTKITLENGEIELTDTLGNHNITNIPVYNFRLLNDPRLLVDANGIMKTYPGISNTLEIKDANRGAINKDMLDPFVGGGVSIVANLEQNCGLKNIWYNGECRPVFDIDLENKYISIYKEAIAYIEKELDDDPLAVISSEEMSKISGGLFPSQYTKTELEDSIVFSRKKIDYYNIYTKTNKKPISDDEISYLLSKEVELQLDPKDILASVERGYTSIPDLMRENGLELFAEAYYDDPDDFNMYKVDEGIALEVDPNSLKDSEDHLCKADHPYRTMCNDLNKSIKSLGGGEINIFSAIDENGKMHYGFSNDRYLKDDYLRYTLSCDDYSAIEISVRGKAIKRKFEDVNYALFSFGGNYGGISPGVGPGNGILSDLKDNSFYKVIYIYNGDDRLGDRYIYDDDGIFLEHTEVNHGGYLTCTDEGLFIGNYVQADNLGQDEYINQWADIIEYVKIYSK